MLLLLASEGEKIFVSSLLLTVILGVLAVTIICYVRNKLNRQEALLSKNREARDSNRDDALRQIREVKRSATTLPLLAVLLAVSGVATCHSINESELSRYRNARAHWVSDDGARNGLCADVAGQIVCGLGEGGFKIGLLMFLAATVVAAIPLAWLKRSNERVRAEIVARKVAARGRSEVPPVRYTGNPSPTESRWMRNASIAGDSKFYESLGEEIGPEVCGWDGCERNRLALSVMCRAHHYEMVLKRPCPFQ
ncbi:MAG: hypothetical protein ACJ74T_19495 [Pyrinomonadaceae bacterium]